MNYVKDFPESKLIRLNDILVIYISEQQKSIFKVEANACVQTKFGQIKAEDLVNHPYGLRYNCRKGWVLPLRLTPELWTQLLPHRTQILYQADISLILLQLDIKPGSLVVESGTGSGSLSHAIMRACGPEGFLHTFDVNESRVIEASREFEEHGFADRVKVTNRNVCELGYGEELDSKIDACILDLPKTWEAIPHAYKVLKPNGSRLCTFSPCVEQVQRNVAKMVELKMKDIVTYECLMKSYNVKVIHTRVWTDEVLTGLLEMDKLRYENIKNNLETTKRIKLSTEEEVNAPKNDDTDKESFIPHDSYVYDDIEALKKSMSDPKARFSANLLPRKPVLTRQPMDTVTHSGYLTFASKRVGY